MTTVIIGGGVAGISCLEELIRRAKTTTHQSLTLIAPSPILKGIGDVKRVTEHVEEFEIVDKTAASFDSHAAVKIVQGTVQGLNLDTHEVELANGDGIPYERLCICTGAAPKVLHSSPHVVSLRDMASVHRLGEKLRHAKRVMVVGNGGIALDLMAELKGIKLVWVLKHQHIGEAYFDHQTAEFLLQEFLSAPVKHHPQTPCETSQSRPEIDPDSNCLGEAMGPKWTEHLSVSSLGPNEKTFCIEQDCFVDKITELKEANEANVRVSLTNGHVYDVDLVIAAIGVIPTPTWLPHQIVLTPDGGILVDRYMRTSAEGVYAAGDCCTIDWGDAQSPHWFQMRLWTQAKAMGSYAGTCMANILEEPEIAFKLFTHVTQFFDKRVILLGRYRLENASDVCYRRVTDVDGVKSYTQIILRDGCVYGAVLIGQTDLEETMENLILDRLDVSDLGERLLDPEIDHIFD